MVNGSGVMEASRCTASAVKVEGGAGSGKTQSIVERIGCLGEELGGGATVAAFAATRSAAAELRSRMTRAGVAADRVLVCTPYEYAAEMLSTGEAMEFTGRKPRLLEDFEERILVEDLKVIGIKPRRLREMLKFFFRTYSELGDESPGFLQTTEEKMLSDALSAHLRARGAMLFPELTNMAVRYLRSASSGVEEWKFDYVFADDFQDYSLATQTMLGMLAKKQFFICGNTNATVATMEQYPYPDGLAAFEEEHDDVCVFALRTNERSAGRIVALGNELSAQDGMRGDLACENGDYSGAGVRVVQWTLPNAEFVHVAEYVASRVKGASDPVRPRDAYIAVPNALWGRAIAKVLGDLGVKTASMLSYHALAGDPREWGKCAQLRLFTLLNLACDPGDAAAWRNWCGFGDYLTHSNHWCRLEEYAAEQGIDVVDALEAISDASADSDEPFLGAGVLARRFEQGRAILANAKGKKGFSLINALSEGEKMPATFSELIDPVTGSEGALELFERARGHAEIQFPDEDAVRIGLPQMVVGQQFDTVIVTGFVDGFYPPAEVFGVEMEEERKEQVVQSMRRGLYAATQSARMTLVLSLFQHDEAVSATKLGMHVRRIRDRDGKRMASLSPSSFLEEMGDAVPGIDTSI